MDVLSNSFPCVNMYGICLCLCVTRKMNVHMQKGREVSGLLSHHVSPLKWGLPLKLRFHEVSGPVSLKDLPASLQCSGWSYRNARDFKPRSHLGRVSALTL